VRLNTAAVSGSNPLKINVNAGAAVEYTGAIANQSTTLLIFNAQGAIIKKYEYSITENAMANLAPTVTEYSATGVASNSGNGVFELRNIYPSPSAGKFTIALNKGNAAAEQDIEVQVINIIGQEVYLKKYSFEKGKENIELPPDIASGTYIVRVKEGEQDNYMTRKIMIVN
jgi:hypothetical protein